MTSARRRCACRLSWPRSSRAPIPLRHRDAFTLLCAVMLSAQTTDERVNRVTPALFARAATPEAMAALPEAQILELIRSCGLAPTKAGNLRRMAELVVRRHGGTVPRTLAELEALPGVGHKTASVVMAQAFGVPAFPSTRTSIVWRRAGALERSQRRATERDLRRLFPESCWSTLHLQMIHFGRRYCPARGHDAASCPICSWAAAPRPRRR